MPARSPSLGTPPPDDGAHARPSVTPLIGGGFGVNSPPSVTPLIGGGFGVNSPPSVLSPAMRAAARGEGGVAGALWAEVRLSEERRHAAQVAKRPLSP
eukprot:153268-Prorocentrum_minimum.AAC.2